jgi:NAD(P)-dependent dehydrogenase (short-subunit alcohol dehydrogenase family)
MAFTGKTVVVTGSGRGIGRAVAEDFARNGANVVIAEKNGEWGQMLEKAILSQGHEATFIKTDVCSQEQVKNLMLQTCEKYDGIHILINNAGITRWSSPYTLDLDDWDHIINTNLRSVFLCSRTAARFMRDNGGGSIVNISSTRACMSEPHSEAYAASKGGIVALTHALAASLAPDHIQVNCISPGWIETENYADLRDTDHDQHFAGRVGKPEDIARACLFLTTPGNEFVSGINLIIDGGMTKKMIYEP